MRFKEKGFRIISCLDVFYNLMNANMVWLVVTSILKSPSKKKNNKISVVLKFDALVAAQTRTWASMSECMLYESSNAEQRNSLFLTLSLSIYL